MAQTYDIFLSYSHHDLSIADEIRASLALVGLSCFMAEKDIAVSDKWEKQVRQALQYSGQVLILVTPRSCNSKWLLLESGASWVLQKKLIPLLMFVSADSLPEPIRAFQARTIETKNQVQLLVDELKRQQPRGAQRGQNSSPERITFPEFLGELEGFLLRITQERWIPDLIIGSGRGGIIAGAIIATNLGHKPLKMVDCHFRWQGLQRFTNIDTSSLQTEDILKKKILVVESTRQMGETYQMILTELEKHSPQEVRSFATIWRTDSPSKPDYYAFSLDSIPSEPWDIGFLYSIHDHII